ncbi:hypothetical protein HpEKA49_04970 [Helicobacter pylori]
MIPRKTIKTNPSNQKECGLACYYNLNARFTTGERSKFNQNNVKLDQLYRCLVASIQAN